MKVILQPTSKIVSLIVGGYPVPARIWEGVTGAGIPVHAFIVRIACRGDADASELAAELEEQRAPSAEVAAIPLRLII
jgi:hypothetical protein